MEGRVRVVRSPGFPSDGQCGGGRPRRDTGSGPGSFRVTGSIISCAISCVGDDGTVLLGAETVIE